MKHYKRIDIEDRYEDLDIYDEDFIDELVEDDEISSEEAGFMMGYEGIYDEE